MELIHHNGPWNKLFIIIQLAIEIVSLNGDNLCYSEKLLHIRPYIRSYEDPICFETSIKDFPKSGMNGSQNIAWFKFSVASVCIVLRAHLFFAFERTNKNELNIYIIFDPLEQSSSRPTKNSKLADSNLNWGRAFNNIFLKWEQVTFFQGVAQVYLCLSRPLSHYIYMLLF